MCRFILHTPYEPLLYQSLFHNLVDRTFRCVSWMLSQRIITSMTKICPIRTS